jgi:glycosyltransferase involved in cell wall biosynthesis
MDSSEEKLMQIVLLDTGSADNTPKIMENLAYDYSVIKIVKPDNLAEYLKTLA